jgi:hypothetical protein
MNLGPKLKAKNTTNQLLRQQPTSFAQTSKLTNLDATTLQAISPHQPDDISLQQTVKLTTKHDQKKFIGKVTSKSPDVSERTIQVLEGTDLKINKEKDALEGQQVLQEQTSYEELSK